MTVYSPADAKKNVGRTPTVVEENLNVELLRKTMDYIATHPQVWHQGSWFWIYDSDKDTVIPHQVEITYEEVNSCNTAFCFAGHAALMEGFIAPPSNTYKAWTRQVDVKGSDDWHYEDVDEFARKRLGLSSDVANELFAAENTIQDLKDMVNLIIEKNGDVSYEELDEIRNANEELEDEDEDSEDVF